MKRAIFFLATFVAMFSAAAEAAPLANAAQLFGARSSVLRPELSPDGKYIVHVAGGPQGMTLAMVTTVATGQRRPIARAEAPWEMVGCGWSGIARLICRQYALLNVNNSFVPFTRLVAMNADGTNMVPLGERDSTAQLRLRQFDGQIIDWMSGDDNVLMSREYVSEFSTGRRVARAEDGLGVDMLNTRTAKSKRVENADIHVDGYMSDGRGGVRLKWTRKALEDGTLTGVTTYKYRKAGSREWLLFGNSDVNGDVLEPIAVDSGSDVAYVLKKKDGRRALYRIALDGSLKTELAHADARVDIKDVVTIGRGGRVIGATFVTDRREAIYFDPEYQKLAAALSRGLKNTPLINFISASADEKILLIFAGSDTDPGRYYVFDRNDKSLVAIMLARPELENVQLGSMKSVTYRAADGTEVPAYLTLPPGSDGKGLPAIVMPHGGPSSRDEWGFDWYAQFYATRGYAVLQPNFRGSSGFGDAWFVDNGFKSWRLAVGDVNDGARWLTAQGIAAPGKVAIVGWSYGGYAALQSNILDPALFKAVVAVAPVTDLGIVKTEAQNFTNSSLVERYVGNGAHVEEGSPARHADAFQAPVLMFHGDRDANVGVGQSRVMDRALKKAGKRSEVIVYKGLDHQLDDADARTDMLTRSDALLRAALKLD